MAWRAVLFTGLNSGAWYRCDSSGLVLDIRVLGDAGSGWIGGWYGMLVRLTCNIHDVFDRYPSNTVRQSFTMLR